MEGVKCVKEEGEEGRRQWDGGGCQEEAEKPVSHLCVRVLREKERERLQYLVEHLDILAVLGKLHLKCNRLQITCYSLRT